jgi:hypothetical protein
LAEPALVCRQAVVAGRRSPADVRARLRALADRVPHVPDRDPYAVAMARLGLDGPSPTARVLRERLVAGGYRSRGLLRDALLIATAETGVGVWATDDPGPLRVDGADVVGEFLRVPLFTAPPEPAASHVTVYGLVVAGVAPRVVEEAVQLAAALAGSAAPDAP